MSVKVSGWVWDRKMRPNHKLVLLAYADHADHEGGSIFPGVNLIAAKTGYTERQVRKLSHELEEEGLLVRTGETEQGKWIYAIPIDDQGPSRGGEKFSGGGLKNRSQGGEKFSGGGLKDGAPLLLHEPSVEPSVEPSTRASAREGVWSDDLTDADLEDLESIPMAARRSLVEGAYLAAHGAFYRARSGRTPRAPNIRENRVIRREIEFALGYLGLVVVCGAVRGIFHSKHNTGCNERGELYVDISIALRISNLERFFYLWRRAQPPVAERSTDATPADMARQLAEETRRADPRLEPIADRICSVNVDDLDVAEKALLAIDHEMLSLAESIMTPEARQKLESDLKERVHLVSSRVAPGEVDRQRARIRAHLLRETFGLPTLSLFYDPDLPRRAARARAA